MNKWRFIGLKSVFFILCMLGFSQVQAVDGINTLISKLNSIKSLDCHFVQTVSSKNATISKTSGQILLSRPGRFRWETREPSAQLIVADGQNLWIYDKELEQVIVKAQAKSLGAAGALFLSQSSDAIASDFNLVSFQEGDIQRFVLKAKSSQASFQKVILEFQQDRLMRIELFDQLGQHTQLTLDKQQLNHPFDASLFKFKIPAGVDVIRE